MEGNARFPCNCLYKVKVKLAEMNTRKCLSGVCVLKVKLASSNKCITRTAPTHHISQQPSQANGPTTEPEQHSNVCDSNATCPIANIILCYSL